MLFSCILTPSRCKHIYIASCVYKGLVDMPTHGSITKAGKVAQLHYHLRKDKAHKKPNPKQRNRRRAYLHRMGRLKYEHPRQRILANPF